MRKLFVLICAVSVINIHAQNVGIGTVDPVFKLDVRNGSINTDSLFRIQRFPVLSVKGNANLFIGKNAGLLNTFGSGNTFSGDSSGLNNTTGDENSAFGHGAMFDNTTGSFNTAIGTIALTRNIDGTTNTSIGYNSMVWNQHGNSNVAVGYSALQQNRGGYSNVGIGATALRGIFNGSNLVAVGDSALYNNNGIGVQGGTNTAVGSKSLFANTIGYGNTGIGFQALNGNLDGNGNVALGSRSLIDNTNGSSNTAIGYEALLNNLGGSGNIAIGYSAGVSNLGGNNNLLIGANSNTSTGTLTNATAIGDKALVSSSNSLVLGSISGINGATSSTRVGIGVTNPGATVDVKSSSDQVAKFNSSGAIVGTYIGIYENDIYRGYIGSYAGNSADVDLGTGAGNATGRLHLTIQSDPKLSIEANGNVDLKNELNRTTVTGNANLLPVCYGIGNAIGGVLSSTGNVTNSRTGTGTYEIQITGTTFENTDVAVVTPVGGAKMISATPSAGKVLITIYNSSGSLVDSHFYFVVYKF